jgi:hypothetical protein
MDIKTLEAVRELIRLKIGHIAADDNQIDGDSKRLVLHELRDQLENEIQSLRKPNQT